MDTKLKLTKIRNET